LNRRCSVVVVVVVVVVVLCALFSSVTPECELNLHPTIVALELACIPAAVPLDEKRRRVLDPDRLRAWRRVASASAARRRSSRSRTIPRSSATRRARPQATRPSRTTSAGTSSRAPRAASVARTRLGASHAGLRCPGASPRAPLACLLACGEPPTEARGLPSLRSPRYILGRVRPPAHPPPPPPTPPPTTLAPPLHGRPASPHFSSLPAAPACAEEALILALALAVALTLTFALLQKKSFVRGRGTANRTPVHPTTLTRPLTRTLTLTLTTLALTRHAYPPEQRGRLPELTRTPRRLRWVRTGYAYQSPALGTYRRRRAACPQGPAYCTCWVRVPATAVPYAPRTVASQVRVRSPSSYAMRTRAWSGCRWARRLRSGVAWGEGKGKGWGEGEGEG
jgi:hypothetical protein